MLGQPAPITSALIGLAAAYGLGTAADAVAPRPIEVHDIHFEASCEFANQTWAGCIAQDRTVTPPDMAKTFAAVWSAQIVDAQTGRPVEWCIGMGGTPYVSGRDTIALPLPLWTGRAECTLSSLPPGEYVPEAVWRWGTEEETHTGQPFSVEG
mgnify:CR=1 FL=1